MSALGGLEYLGIGNLLGENESIFKYMAILKSRTLREKVIKKYNLIERYDSENMQLALKELDNYFELELGDEYQLNISMQDKNQDQVADMTNYIVHLLDSMNVAITAKKARNDRKDIGRRYHSLIDSLHRVSNNMAEYMSENGIISLQDQITAGVTSASELQRQIVALETEIDVLKKSVQKNNPILKRKKIELENLKKEYYKILKTDQDYIPKFSEIPKIGAELKKYEKTINYLTRLLEFVGPQYEKFKLDENKETPSLQILDHGRRPDKKYRPKRAIIVIISTFVIGFLACSYFIIRENEID
jgi:capsule polysaccharide export protein KpsE/RkpR